MKRALIAAVLVACFYCAPSISHADDLSSSYYCVVEASGGLAYNENARKWVGTVFRPEGKFVLRLQRVGQRTEKDVFDKYETVTDYKISITQPGDNFPLACAAQGSEDQVVSQRGRSVLYCSYSGSDYGFNITNGRFLESYMAGYLDGRDNNANTPLVSGGTCTRIE